MSLTVILIIVCVAVAAALVAVFLVFGRSEANFKFDIGGGGPKASGGSDTSAETAMQGRLVWQSVVSGGVSAILLAKLWSMQLLSSDEYTQQAESNRTRTVSVPAPRGRILDRNGKEIVTNRSSLTVLAEADVANDDIELTLVGNLIGMPALAVRRKVEDASAGAQSLRPVAVDVSRRVVAFLGEHPTVFPGVSVAQRTQRSYPLGSLAAHVVGYTGTVTADQLSSADSSDEGTVHYSSGDTVGQAGVELQYESVLQGVAGEQTVYVDADGNVLDYSTYVEPRGGSDVVLTLDVDVQRAAEESIARVVEYQRQRDYAATGACAVAIDCTNGEVVAMASYPTYNPSIFVGGISTSDWESLQSEGAHYPLMNRAIAGQYPSGSIIKALTTLAALSYGIATASSSWYCTGWWTGFGEAYGMKCWWTSGHGEMNLVTGITYSCDVVFYEIGKGFFYDKDNPNGMQETFKKFGLGSPTGIDLPSEAAGRVPDADWKWNYWSSASDDQRAWQGGDNCNLSIGQGDLLVTCMQMVDAYAGIANRGPIYKPHVLKSVKSATGSGSVIDYSPEVIINAEEDPANFDTVDQGLSGVIYRESPTQTAHWTNLDVAVCGKTGTAEQTSVGEPVGWFMAFVPADNPRYVVGANVDSVLSGASSAMYVVRDIIGAIYGQPDDEPLDSSNVDR